MKKMLFVMALFVSIGAVASNFTGFYDANVGYATHLKKARVEYKNINKILEKAVKNINENGEKAFEGIKKENKKDGKGYGIFVIDPETGNILISPASETMGNKALENTEINGKALAREAIREAQEKLTETPFERWTGFVGTLYNDYFTRIAITENGKVYVLAIGKSNLDLQYLFIEKVVGQACELIEKKGLDTAIKDFDKQDGIFRFKDTYMFVYQLVDGNKLIGVYNPNYPEDIGNDVLKLEPIISDPYKEMIKFNNFVEGGWVDSESKPVGETRLVEKAIFVKFIKLNGNNYMVGSGVYLDKYK